MAVPYSQGSDKNRHEQFAGLILLTALLLLPALLPEKIGWLTSFVPLPIFYYLIVLGKKDGTLLIRNAILLAAAGALLFGSMEMLLFSLTMVPVGVAFSQAVYHRKTPVAAGFTGSLLLALAWLLYWGGLGILQQTNPYGALLEEFDTGLASGLMLYEESAGLAPETLQSVRSAVELLRAFIPKVLPALLVSAILTTTWLNLTLGNWLLRKKSKELTPWSDYKEWQLPEPLVWLVVTAGLAVFLLPDPIRIIGLNLIFVCIVLYFFQGLAIVVSLMQRWSVPRFIRVLIYALIFIQTYGIILLSFLGLADVWADFRKLNRAGDSPNTSL